MIRIDGSHGEGGGQILRTSVSLSALTMQPVRITNIRAGRPKPGLRRQHMAGIEVTGQLVNARLRGVEVGSTEVEFVPEERQGGDFSCDIGTAGSISLVLQAFLPPAVLSPEPVRLHLKGGTDVAWSPPVDYLQQVFAHVLRRVGPRVDIVQRRRGHYPRGGGSVSCTVTPVEELVPMNLIEFGALREVKGISHCVRLPSHVADRQASSAETFLRSHGVNPVHITRETYPKSEDPHLGPGSGIVLWAESESGIRLGCDRLGERGKRAETVGVEAARQMLSELSTERAVDSHLCDMLVPYLALASGESRVGLTEVTSHLRTNIWVSEQILGSDMLIEGKTGGPGTLHVRGAGFSLRDG